MYFEKVNKSFPLLSPILGFVFGSGEKPRENAPVIQNETPIFFLMFIYFLERDRAWAGVGWRERETESEAGSRLPAVSTEPHEGLELSSSEITT